MGEYTATDIITFIGVPLAVLGVMPLLWNMVKAFLIRRHLIKALPPSLRRHYSIIMDPAAGTASITLPNLFLTAGSLVGYGEYNFTKVAELPPGSGGGVFRYAPEIDSTKFRKVRGPKLPPMLDLARGIVSVEKYKGAGPAASWMRLPVLGVIPNRDLDAFPVRLTVQSDFNCPPSLLSCKWPTFVSLAMCLQIYPLDKTGRCHDALAGLRDALRHQTKIATPMNLRHLDGNVILQVSPEHAGNVAKFEASSLAYTLNAMLAWHNVMLNLSGKGLKCVALPSLETFSLCDILAFSTEGIVRWRQPPSPSGLKRLSPQPFEPYRIDIRTTKWRRDTFEHCLTWTLYAEAEYLNQLRPIPTSQTFLIWQDMSVVWLGRRERKKLYEQLAELITNVSLLRHTKEYLGECWSTPIFFTGTTPPHLNPSYDILDITPLTDPAIFRAKLEEKGGGSHAGALRNATRLGSEYDPQFCKTRPYLWQYLKRNEVGHKIAARYDPDLEARTRTDDVLVPGSLEELAAHLLIATAIFKAWPRADWFLHWTDVDDDGRVHYRTYNDNPIASVLKGESSEEDLAMMGAMYIS